jgi:23S rRNA (uridine2552-2'-O)-methyltransferase
MKRSKSSKAWMHEHVNDHFVKRAQTDGFRSRAAYKLMEIDEKDKLLKPGMMVVDLGAAPGSWTQAVSRKLGHQGRILATDILEMGALPHVEFIQGDFTEAAVLRQIEAALGGRLADLVISDMAPNMSGVGIADQTRAMYLCELALDFCVHHLKPGGNFLVKVFQGAGFEPFLKAMRGSFRQVVTRKPKASRDRSSEIYLLGKGLLTRGPHEAGELD